MRLIDADTMYDCKTCYHDSSGKCQLGIFGCDHGEAYRPAFSKMEIVDAALVVHGAWFEVSARELFGSDSDQLAGYVCSECGFDIEECDADAFNYCPNCGAKMDGDK